MSASSLGVGLYGDNGHQIHHLLDGHPRARLVATAAFDPALLPPGLAADPLVRHHVDLGSLLADPRVELVSLCSPRRADQARDAIVCLRAGRCVYAEKPAAFTESDLDAVLDAAAASGRAFHEMADTAFEQPYLAIREQIAAGAIGRVVQVHAQKSYPWHDGRSADEDVDGGLIRWCGVHAVRFVEHVAAQRVVDVHAVQTTLGDPRGDGLVMAAVLSMTLAGGGLASAVLNYLNPPGFGRWGNDHLRVFGTAGFIEATDGGAHTRMVVGGEDHGPLDISAPAPNYFDRYLAALLDGTPMPLSLDEELRPTRVVIRARGSLSADQPL